MRWSQEDIDRAMKATEKVRDLIRARKEARRARKQELYEGLFAAEENDQPEE